MRRLWRHLSMKWRKARELNQNNLSAYWVVAAPTTHSLDVGLDDLFPTAISFC